MRVSAIDNVREHITLSETQLRYIREVFNRPKRDVLTDFQRAVQWIYGGFPTNIHYLPEIKAWECDIIRVE